MLAKIQKTHGFDKVVPIAFHVDYFNKPWKDPFSDLAYSRREMAYNEALNRTDLYFTPMLMIDGRFPMLGSNEPESKRALTRALAEKPGATLDFELKGEPTASKRPLSVTVESKSPLIYDRELLVGVAINEDPVITKVESGENEGKTLVEHFAARKFLFQKATLGRDDSKTFKFDLELGQGWRPDGCRVAIFVQDWKNGRVFQADSVKWTPEKKSLKS